MQQQLAGQDSTAGDRFSLRLDDIKQALLLPYHTQVLHRHAIRLLVQQAADSIDTVADAVKQVVKKAFHDLRIWQRRFEKAMLSFIKLAWL